MTSPQVELLLNHGHVRLVDKMGDDLSIVRAARVSYDAAWRAGMDDEKDRALMRRLWSGKPSVYKGKLPELPKHSTPFEAVTMTFEVMAPIFVFRQWHRHRTQSYNELSARYRELPESFYIPTPEAVGVQSTDNKQGRDTNVDEAVRILREGEIRRQESHMRSGFTLYRELLASGWPKELARGHLPFNTFSHMFATMNLLNFFKFATLRVDPHAQYEIRVYAAAMLTMVQKFAPEATALFAEANNIMV